MVCPYCESETVVTNSRPQKRNNQVWRRRRCNLCGTLFTTHEAADLSSLLIVITASGQSRPFLADFLFTELLLALQDRKDAYVAAREANATIIRKLLELPGKPQFEAAQISSVAGGVLALLDRRAWLRYVAEHPSLQS